VISDNGKTRQELAPGDFALIPAWTEHQEVNEGDEEVTVRPGTFLAAFSYCIVPLSITLFETPTFYRAKLPERNLKWTKANSSLFSGSSQEAEASL